MNTSALLVDIPRPEKYTQISWSIRMPQWLAEAILQASTEFGVTRTGFVRGALIAHLSLVRRMCYKVLDSPKAGEAERERIRALIEVITEGLAVHAAIGGSNPADSRVILDDES